MCYGGTSIATAYPYGGVAPYFFNWSNNANTQSTSLSVGQSIIIITDTNGCSFTDSIMVYQNDSILMYNNISAISCNGANDGSIAISIPSGGQIPFQYSVDNGATFQNTNQFSSLSVLMLLQIQFLYFYLFLNLFMPRFIRNFFCVRHKFNI